jgi:hypothetical protein
MGAHENGGRGCAGCHAPHSGGRGSGGNIIQSTGNTNPGYGFTLSGVAEGGTGLWGTDTNPIQTGYGSTMTFDGKYTMTVGGLNWASGGAYTGVVTCLSCHDGNVSTGAMMSNQAYEQAWGLLNFATAAGSNGGKVVALYGSQVIPTLLGNDGGTLGDYSNDHPIGPSANLYAAMSDGGALPTGLVVTAAAGYNGGAPSVKITVPTTGPYATMIASYGYPALQGLVSTGDGSVNGSGTYVVCTTCHNQHVMNVFAATPGGAWQGQPATLIAGSSTAKARTIFFVKGPYNPGAPYDPTHVPSTMRFCQQCHFSMSSESYGATNIGTAF